MTNHSTASPGPDAPVPLRRGRRALPHLVRMGWAAALILLAGCATPPPLASFSLSDPGVTVRQGQAVWRARRDAPEIAGDVILARHTNGAVWVQFSKSPFPILMARTDPAPPRWRAEIPARNRSYQGRGRPPVHLAWLHLGPALLDRLPPPPPWQITMEPDPVEPKAPLRWRMENPRNGERLEGFLNP